MKTALFTTSFIIFTLTGLLLLAGLAVVALLSPQTSIAIVAPVPVQPVSGTSPEEQGRTLSFTLVTIAENGGLAYQGLGGSIDGLVNPMLNVRPGDTVRITIINGDGMPHDLYLPDFDARSAYVAGFGDQVDVVFEIGETLPGSYVYYCTLPGHRNAGQEGLLVVGE